MSAPVRTVVHLMRHGEVHNPEGVLYGRLPGYRLSELGRQMAHLVGQHLSDRDITLVVASPLDRAQETAAPIAEPHGLDVVIDERAIEAGNSFEGQRGGSSPMHWLRPGHWSKLVNPFTPSWGEPYVEIAARMHAVVADARERARGHEAVVVSHQLPVWTVRNSLAGRRLWHDPRRRECTLASLTSLTYLDDELAAIEYTEPAGALLVRSHGGVGA
jgi:broad specificity phosphatase PhoE